MQTRCQNGNCNGMCTVNPNARYEVPALLLMQVYAWAALYIGALFFQLDIQVRVSSQYANTKTTAFSDDLLAGVL